MVCKLMFPVAVRINGCPNLAIAPAVPISCSHYHWQRDRKASNGHQPTRLFLLGTEQWHDFLVGCNT